MVSLPKGSQVAANGSAGFNRMSGAYQDGTGASSTDIDASKSSSQPIVNVTVKLGNEELKQLFYSVDVDALAGPANKLASSIDKRMAQNITKLPA